MAGTATPATRIAQAAGALVALHAYDHDPRAPSYALEAAEALGLDRAAVFKTLVCRLTGYVTGGISPLGQRRRLRTFVDASAEPQVTIHVSAGRRGLELEIAPDRLAELTGAAFAPLSGAGS